MSVPDERPLEVVKTADPEVRAFFERVWRWFVQGWTPGRIARALEAEGLLMPVRGPGGKIRWVRPTLHAITRIRRNPFYAGLLVVWRRRTERTPEGKRIRYTTPAEQEVVEGKIERYVSPDEFWRIQAQAAGRKFPMYNTSGEGPALCPGLIHCPQCGRHLQVVYVWRKRPTRHLKTHYYRCQGPEAQRHTCKYCTTISGRLLDELVEQLVLERLRCPSPAVLRRAIAEENARRQEGHRLLAGGVQRARARVEEVEGWLEEPRNREKHPTLVEHYENKLVAAIQAKREAEQRLARCPTPEPLETSAAFVADVAAVFRKFPRLWRSDRLGPRQRKTVIQHLVQRIDLPEKGDTLRIRITFHTGEVVERTFLTDQGRRQLIEALHEEGLNPQEIAAELQRLGVRNHGGRPVTAVAVKGLLRRRHPPRRRAIHERIKSLWDAGLLPWAIAVRLNEEHLETERQRPWTATTVVRAARRLGLLPPSAEVREALRAPLLELLGQGLSDEAIGVEFTRRSLRGWNPEVPWNREKVRTLRRLLGVRGSYRARKRRLRRPDAGI